MNYVLPDFPPDVQYEVEVAKIWYGEKFKRRMQDPRYQHYWRVDPEDLLIVYILGVWRVFLREADARRLWWAADLNSKALEFLRQLTKELYFEKGFGYEGRRQPAMLAIDGVILDRVMEKFVRSGTWKYFEEVRLRVTEPAKQPAAALDRPLLVRGALGLGGLRPKGCDARLGKARDIVTGFVVGALAGRQLLGEALGLGVGQIAGVVGPP